MSLSSIIVQREIASIREVEEALARQVLYGGDLVTNLLEVCRADEASLVSAAADAYGLPAAPPGELPVAGREVQRLVPADIAQERNLAPIALDDGGLVVAVAEPLAREVEDELAFALAVPITQKIAPLVRIRQALARDYGLPMERRIARLLARMGSPVSVPEGPGVAPVAPAVPLPLPPTAPKVASLMPPPIRMETGPGTLIRVSNLPPAPPQKRRRGPFTADVASRELEEASARDAIFDLAFEFTKQFFEYTAMFVVHGEIAEGRDAFGSGTSREKVARIGVPLDMPGLLATAFSRAGLFRAVPDAVGLDRVLLTDLGRAGTTECIIVPIVVRKRVVALILGDTGDARVDAGSLGEIERVVARATAAFERLILRRKLQGSKHPEPPPKAPSTRPGLFDERAMGTDDLTPAIRAALAAPATPRVDVGPGPVRRTTLTGMPAMRKPLSDMPPPENVFAVRRPSGAPIPREEPESSPKIPAMARRRPSSSSSRAVAPKFDFSGGDGMRPAPSASEAETPIAPEVMTPAGPVVAAALVPELPPVTAKKRAPKPMPASEQQISVAAHKPPSAREVRLELPSIMVDVGTEYSALVHRLLAAPDDDEAESELLRGGEAAMPALMAQFPGPITIDRAKLDQSPLPRVSECGPIVRVIAEQRRGALASVVARLDSGAIEVRFWATYLLSELVYLEALEALVPRIFDEDARVRRAARGAARAFADAYPQQTVDRLAAIASAADLDAERRVLAVEALGETREPLAVPALVELAADETSVASAARTALALITRRDFGTDGDKWRVFWQENQERHRIEWLIDALVHESQPMRAAANEELNALTKEYFGYYEDLPKRERERVRARYEKWWNEVGRVKFARLTR